jgi:hypothetical protein
MSPGEAKLLALRNATTFFLALIGSSIYKLERSEHLCRYNAQRIPMMQCAVDFDPAVSQSTSAAF